MIFFPKQENDLKATNNLQLIQKIKLESSWTSMEELNISGTHCKHKQQKEGFQAMHDVNSIFTGSFN